MRWGIVGPGAIAGWVTPDLASVDGVEVVAVASRDRDRAAAFASEHGIHRSHGSYEGVFADPGIDVVYIATPHATHRDLAMAALRAGKHVLCEKAFTMTEAEAAEVVAVAAAEDRFLMEAMWMRFNPVVVRALELIADGAIGMPIHTRSFLSFVEPYDERSRRWDPAQGGGAVHEVGVYPLSLAHFVHGAPSTVAAAGRVLPDGVDADATIALGYPGGAHASLGCSMSFDIPTDSVIAGDRGRIELSSPTYLPTELRLVTSDGSSVERPPQEGRGYVPMFRHVDACVRDAMIESPVLPLAGTIERMAVVDAVRNRLLSGPRIGSLS